MENDLYKMTNNGIIISSKVIELYENNKDFKSYVDKHCKVYNKTKREALFEKVVLSYAEYIINKNVDKQDWILGK